LKKAKKVKYFWKGVKYNIPVCCIIFFNSAWDSIKISNKEYAQTMTFLTNNEGIILCPDCLVKVIKNKKAKALPIIQRKISLI